MSDVAVREATAADVPRIAALIAMGNAAKPMTAEEAEAEGRLPVYAEAFARVAASEANRLFVAEKDGRVVGTYQLTVLPGIAERGRTRGKIESVHVDPTLRGTGVGAEMMRHALDRARQAGIGLIELSSNKSRTDAHRFYERLGFAKSHEGFKMVLD
ncbi:GNAT family N-acetyltransferase [Phreatobacter cathodiphilus]|uniref:GNAT family N-acetyltransferase n=1 Tax=Phreatobacter cathodiphilus TaxID=1868589 RepID=A0A2S0NAZ0_9HYPH|nr:GNAT family N-acetyltransferase [Phreatobacter cathodiphilus]AVO45339.1 GNAT family N-acetyltransferase [Phreatobacter cathodiphilus]